MNNQIIILAGGESSRFYPFNKIHKSFFNIAGKSIIQRTIDNIFDKFDTEIIIVLAKKNFDVEKKIIESYGYGNKIKYVSQKKSLGMSDAILSAKEYIKDSFFVINSQQLDVVEYVNLFLDKLIKEHGIVVVGSCETNSPNNYGILKFNGDRPTGLIEKPKKGEEPSNQRVVGIYLFKNEFIRELEKTPVSQYSLETTLDRVAKSGGLSCVKINNKLNSLKYPWDLFYFKNDYLKNIDSHIDSSSEIAKTAIIRGDVYICKNAKVYDFSIIEGPAYIGEGVVVGSFSQVRGGTILEKNSKIQRYVDIKNSILGENSSIHSGFVGDSIIGNNVKIGAGFTVANKRLDRKNIKVDVKGERVDTGVNNLGIFLGEGSSVGINVSTMPGSILGLKGIIYPKIIYKGTK